MPRALRLVPAHERRDAEIVDTVVLTSEQRRAGQGEVVGLKGTTVTLDLPAGPPLRTDDCLMLEDGRLVEVAAAAEPLCEVRAGDPAALARLAWQLGDRHIAVEVLPNRLRVRREPAVDALFTALGAEVAVIEAPFEPEGGAYAVSHEHAAHDHDYHHDHGHHHHHHKAK